MEFTQNLGLTPSNNGDFAQDFFDCSLHKKHREKCGGHFIRVKVLEQLVLKHMQLVMGYILRHEDYFRTVMEQQMKLESAEKLQVIRKQLNRDEKRITELKRLFIKIYEDNASGRLNDERFDIPFRWKYKTPARRRAVRPGRW